MPTNPALVHDFAKQKKLVYLKDLNYDADDRPVILFLTSSGHLPGAESGPHAWHTARWTGTKWEIHPFATSDHNYDHGSLYIEPGGTWNIIAPLGAGAANLSGRVERCSFGRAGTKAGRGKRFAISRTIVHATTLMPATAARPS